MRARLFVVLALAVAVAGCTASVRGQSALRQGNYVDAAMAFEEALAENPGRLDALIGLGVARYKLGLYPEAAQLLAQAVTRGPRDAGAQLYLGVAYLQTGELARAAEHLRAYRDLRAEDRMAAQVDRAVAVLGARELPADVRQFMATSLEEQAALARELREARTWPPAYAYAGPFPFFYDCVPIRFGRVVCF